MVIGPPPLLSKSARILLNTGRKNLKIVQVFFIFHETLKKHVHVFLAYLDHSKLGPGWGVFEEKNLKVTMYGL